MSGNVIIQTQVQGWRKVRPTANSIDASFPSRIATITEPTGDGVIVTCDSYGSVAQNGMVLVPYGTLTNDQTYSVRILGWRRLPGAVGTSADVWLPITLAELACTTGTKTGVAGGAVVVAELFADTLTLTTGDAGVSIDVVSPGDDTIAHVVLDIKGCQKVEVIFSLAGGGGTDMNALVSLL